MRLRALLVVALSAGAMVPVHAADQSIPRGPSYYTGASYHPTSIDWTGWYVGGQLGGAFGSASWTNPFSGLSDSPSPAGIVAGGQVGVNWTRDSWLLGAEADFTWTGLNGSAGAGGFVHTVHSHWLSLVTGRVGYAFGPYLAYAKGGGAFGSERNEVVNTVSGLTADSGTTTQVGWTIGAGLEYAIDPHWSARLEYDFVDLPSHDMALHGTLPGLLPANVDLTIHKIVAGINYRF